MFGKLKIMGHVLGDREELVLRDYLALERTRLANERTFLAYLRSSLYMLLGGLAFLELAEFRKIRWFAYVALGLSVVLFVSGILRYGLTRSRLASCYESCARREPAASPGRAGKLT